MASENKKDFNQMMNNNKDMPKIVQINDPKGIKKWGGKTMIINEGHVIITKGNKNIKYFVKDYIDKLFRLTN